jgi:tripartite-type tricarboxylate transporter receptor subunit TctC
MKEEGMRVRGLLTACALLLLATSAAAEYPDKPVRIVSPFAVGGGGDIASRIVAQKVSENTGKTFVVDNKVGAGGRIGYEYGARAAPDGYTLIASDTTYTMMPGLYGGYPWGNDLDLVPVTILVTTPFVIVASPKLKVSTLSELIALAKAQPGKLNFGSAGTGSINHVSTELLKREAGIDLVHVPYKGMGDAITGMLTGSVDLLVIGVITARPHIASGKMVPLAVASTKRSISLPDVPSVVEAGLPGFQAGNWFAWSAPKGTPREVVDYLQREAAKALASPDVRDRLLAQGSEPSGITPAEFDVVVRNDLKRWTEVIKAAGIKAE